jgi:hypothetical protein
MDEYVPMHPLAGGAWKVIVVPEHFPARGSSAVSIGQASTASLTSCRAVRLERARPPPARKYRRSLLPRFARPAAAQEVEHEQGSGGGAEKK